MFPSPQRYEKRAILWYQKYQKIQRDSGTEKQGITENKKL